MPTAEQVVTAVFIRPNGKTYRPRKPGLRARAWENDGYDGRAGVIVFGTLTPDAARRFAGEAAAYWFGDADTFEVCDPSPGWWRDGFTVAGRTWVEHAGRGAPGVMFTWSEKIS